MCIEMLNCGYVNAISVVILSYTPFFIPKVSKTFQNKTFEFMQKLEILHNCSTEDFLATVVRK